MPEPTPPIQKPLRYGFLLLPQFSLSAWALAADALTRANVLAERRVFETLTLSLEGERVRAGCGVVTFWCKYGNAYAASGTVWQCDGCADVLVGLAWIDTEANVNFDACVK